MTATATAAARVHLSHDPTVDNDEQLLSAAKRSNGLEVPMMRALHGCMGGSDG